MENSFKQPHVPLCPTCSVPVQPVILDVAGAFKLYGCGRCDLQVWEPRQSPGPGWYDQSDHYLAKSVVDWLGWYHTLSLGIVSREAKTLLDIGCADGRFVYAAARRGVDAVGIDFSERLVRLGNERYGGDRLKTVTLDAYLQESRRSTDAVTMFEVIEHVEDPLGLLTQVIQAARPGGLIVVSTPNRLGYPKPPRAYDTPPHHFTRWSPTAFRNVAAAAGLTNIHVEICPPAVAIKGYLLDRFRLNLATRILRARRDWARRTPGANAGAVGTQSDVRRMIKAKDLAAGAVAKAIAPFVGRWFPGPSMVLVARRPKA